MFRGPDSMGFVWGGVGRARVQFMHFSAIFAMLTVLSTSVTPCTHSEGCEWGCCDSICLVDTEGRFLQSVALSRASQCRCQRREMAVSPNNGLVNGPVHNLLMQCFTLGSSKIEVFETYFFDIVIT